MISVFPPYETHFQSAAKAALFLGRAQAIDPVGPPWSLPATREAP